MLATSLHTSVHISVLACMHSEVMQSGVAALAIQQCAVVGPGFILLCEGGWECQSRKLVGLWSMLLAHKNET